MRTNRVEVYLRGAASSDGAFQVKLKQLGHETLANANGNLLSVSHDPRVVPFKYHVDAATGKITVNTTGDNLHLDNDDYAPLGPFADWTITIDPALHTGLDLSGLTSIDLIFSGKARSFV